MNRVKIGDLEVGTAFRADWREDGMDVGELLHIGLGSCNVRIPHLNGSGWDYTTWSLGTEVVPVTREELNTLSMGSTDRNKSSADSPVQMVHAICDQMKGKPRNEIIAACVAKGINPNTAKTQYYHWRKQN